MLRLFIFITLFLSPFFKLVIYKIYNYSFTYSCIFDISEVCEYLETFENEEERNLAKMRSLFSVGRPTLHIIGYKKLLKTNMAPP